MQEIVPLRHKKLQIMLGKLPLKSQSDIFRPI